MLPKKHFNQYRKMNKTAIISPRGIFIQKRIKPICRSYKEEHLPVFQLNSYQNTSLSSIEDLLEATKKLNDFERSECFTSFGLNYFKVKDHYDYVCKLEKAFTQNNTNDTFMFNIFKIIFGK